MAWTSGVVMIGWRNSDSGSNTPVASVQTSRFQSAAPRRERSSASAKAIGLCGDWTEDEATYHGPYVDFDRIAVWPKPVQKPHPPVLLAGNGASAERRVLDHADGWAPVAEPGIPDRVRRLRSAALAADRKASVTLVACPVSAAEFEELEHAGVDRCVHWVDSMHADDFEAHVHPF